MYENLIVTAILALCSANAKIPLSLNRQGVNEGPCLIPYPTATLIDNGFLMKVIMNMKTPFFVPMGSEHLYRSYATYLLGRPPTSQQELNAMQLRIRASLTHTWHSTGYGRYIDQQCFLQGHLFRASCYATKGSNGTDLQIIRQTTDTLVYTDNKAVFLIVRCVLGTENDWKLLSLFSTVDPATRAEVFKKVEELGFTNESNWATASYY